MEKKMTKREVINAMLQEEVVKGNEVYVNYLNHEIELLDKKSSSHKPTKNQVANEALKDNIKAFIGEAEEPVTATDVAKGLDITVQKVSALVKQMVDSGVVVKTIDKRKAYLTLAD